MNQTLIEETAVMIAAEKFTPLEIQQNKMEFLLRALPLFETLDFDPSVYYDESLYESDSKKIQKVPTPSECLAYLQTRIQEWDGDHTPCILSIYPTPYCLAVFESVAKPFVKKFNETTLGLKIALSNGTVSTHDPMISEVYALIIEMCLISMCTLLSIHFLYPKI